MRNRLTDPNNLIMAGVGFACMTVLADLGVDAMEQKELVEQTRERAQQVASSMAEGSVGRLHAGGCRESKFGDRKRLEYMKSRTVEYKCGDIKVICRPPSSDQYYCSASELSDTEK